MRPLSKAIITLGITALAFTSQAALATDWALVSEGSQSTLYVDRTSIKRTGATITYWIRNDYVNDKDGWKQTVSLIEANCTTRAKRRLQATIYLVDGTLRTYSTSGEWSYVVPDSMGQAELNFTCPLN